MVDTYRREERVSSVFGCLRGRDINLKMTATAPEKRPSTATYVDSDIKSTDYHSEG